MKEGQVPRADDAGTRSGGRIRVGVSACLLGEEVRYDGGHQRHTYVTERLGRAFEVVPECPEVGIGLGVPRPKIRLESDGGSVRLVASDGAGLTGLMERYARETAERFLRAGVAGVVLKSRSPSCGIGDVKVYRGAVLAGRGGTGVFAGTLARAAPELPLLPETDFDRPALRDHWLTRVFALAEFRDLAASGPGMGALFRFHARWKMELMAHSEVSARRLGRLLAEATDAATALSRYRDGFFAGLARPASRGTHRNVLEHLAGHLKGRLGAADRRALRETIRTFSEGTAPLARPLSAIAGWARRLEVRSLMDQACLTPRPSCLRYREE